jgi:hypothetical protein
MIFEVMDFPPLLWIIDAHSLWHLATAGLPFIFYRYVYWWHCVQYLSISSKNKNISTSLGCTALENCLDFLFLFNFV